VVLGIAAGEGGVQLPDDVVAAARGETAAADDHFSEVVRVAKSTSQHRVVGGGRHTTAGAALGVQLTAQDSAASVAALVQTLDIAAGVLRELGALERAARKAADALGGAAARAPPDALAEATPDAIAAATAAAGATCAVVSGSITLAFSAADDDDSSNGRGAGSDDNLLTDPLQEKRPRMPPRACAYLRCHASSRLTFPAHSLVAHPLAPLRAPSIA
jgi:hypothetical protein